MLSGMMVFVDPEIVKDLIFPGLYLPFWVLFFPASFLSAAIMVADSKKGFLIGLGISSFLLLRVYGLGNFLNGLLIGGIVVTVDRYWSS